MTGGRIKRLKKYLNDENFMLTYGDGLSNVNLKKLLKFHKDKKKIVTLTAVNPPARFGALQIKNGIITKFKEKIKLKESWINGGFFVVNKKYLNIFNMIKLIWKKSHLKNSRKKIISQLISIMAFGSVWIQKEIKTSLKIIIKNEK